MRRGMPIRSRDPVEDVRAALDRARGLRTQRDTDSDLALLERFGAGDNNLQEIINSPVVYGKLKALIESGDAFLLQVPSSGVAQVIVGTYDVGLAATAASVRLGEDILTNGYRLKLWGNNGDITTASGVLLTTTHSWAKWDTGAHKRPNAAALDVDGSAAWTVGSGATDDDTTTGMWLRFTTAASTGDAKGPNGPLMFLTALQAEIIFVIQTGPDITNERQWVGAFSGDPSGSSTPNLHFAGYRYVGGVDTDWRCYTSDGSNRTQVGSGVTVQATTTYFLRLRLFPALAQFRIGLPGFGAGEQALVNIATTLPASNQYLAPWSRLTTLENTSKYYRFNMFRGASGDMVNGG